MLGVALALGLAVRLLAFTRPYPAIDLAFVPDDTYYTLAIARSLAHGNGPAAGAGIASSGFQPLLAFLMAPVYRVTDNLHLAFRADLLLLIGADLASIVLLHRLGRRIAGPVAGLAAALVWAASPVALRNAMGGLEASLAVALALALLLAWLRTADAGDTPLRFVVLGAVAGLLILARIDAALLVLLVAAIELVLRRGRRVLPAVIGLAVVTVPWYLYATVTFGSPMPTSGAAEGRLATLPRLGAAVTSLTSTALVGGPFTVDAGYRSWFIRHRAVRAPRRSGRSSPCSRCRRGGRAAPARPAFGTIDARRARRLRPLRRRADRLLRLVRRLLLRPALSPARRGLRDALARDRAVRPPGAGTRAPDPSWPWRPWPCSRSRPPAASSTPAVPNPSTPISRSSPGSDPRALEIVHRFPRHGADRGLPERRVVVLRGRPARGRQPGRRRQPERATGPPGCEDRAVRRGRSACAGSPTTCTSSLGLSRAVDRAPGLGLHVVGLPKLPGNPVATSRIVPRDRPGRSGPGAALRRRALTAAERDAARAETLAGRAIPGGR